MGRVETEEIHRKDKQYLSPRHSKICQILLFMFPEKGIGGGCKERSEVVNQ